MTLGRRGATFKPVWRTRRTKVKVGRRRVISLDRATGTFRVSRSNVREFAEPPGCVTRTQESPSPSRPPAELGRGVRCARTGRSLWACSGSDPRFHGGTGRGGGRKTRGERKIQRAARAGLASFSVHVRG